MPPEPFPGHPPFEPLWPFRPFPQPSDLIAPSILAALDRVLSGLTSSDDPSNTGGECPLTTALAAEAAQLRSWLAAVRRQKARFSCGPVYATTDALVLVPQLEIALCLSRHLAGDWGDLCAEDWEVNDRSLADGTRLLSAYETRAHVRFWIITEGDRSATTVLLPHEY